MPKRTDGASRGPGRQTEAAPPPLPDLTGVSLRTLRTSDDPTVAAAVENALRAPGELARVWRSDGTQGGNVLPVAGARPPAPGGVPAHGARTSGEQVVFRSTCGPRGATGGAGGPGGDSTGRHAPL